VYDETVTRGLSRSPKMGAHMNQIYKSVLGLILLFGVSFCRQQEPFYINVLRSDVFHQLYGEHKYDFLWVFDNSPSMKPKRDYVRDNLNRFIKILNTRKAVDFQMSMTTTDYFDQTKDPADPFKFFVTPPSLVKNANGLEVVLSSSPNSVGDFASLLDEVKGSITGFWEMGLEASMQAINVNGEKFMRNGVPLVVIYVSDEEDYSCQSHCWGVEPENNPDDVVFPEARYHTFFKDLVDKKALPELLVFSIVGTQDSVGKCVFAGEGSIGQRYINLQLALGTGMSASICSSDLNKSYDGVAKFLSDRGIRFPLTRPSTGTGINVFVNQKKVPYSEEDGFYFEGKTNSIIFTGDQIPKNGDAVEVVYTEQHS